MRKIFQVLMGVVLIAGLSGPAFADSTFSVYTRVAYNVISTVGVVVMAPAIPDYQITATNIGPQINVTFNIHSNSEKLQFTAGATKLYKGDQNTSAFYLTQTKGVNFYCENAGIINGALNLQPYGPPTQVNGWDGLQAGPVVFDSGTNGTFSQNCILSFWWKSALPDLELPPGQYSGFVKLVATVQP